MKTYFCFYGLTLECSFEIARPRYHFKRNYELLGENELLEKDSERKTGRL